MLPIVIDEFDAVEQYKTATTDAQRAYLVAFLSESKTSRQVRYDLGIENKYLLSYLKRAGKVLSEEELELWDKNAHSLSLGHIRALVGYKEEKRDKIMRDVISKGLSVRDVEAIKHNQGAVKSSDLSGYENKLGQAIGAPVEIQYDSNTQSGKLTISFFSLEELDDKAEKLGYKQDNW